MRRLDWLWVALVAGLLLMAAGLRPPRHDSGADSFAIGASGKSAFYALADLLLEGVHRSTDHLLPPKDADVLVMLGPARYPNRAEWSRLHAWVSEGKALLFAARWEDPEVDLEPFGARIIPTDTEPAEAPVTAIETNLAEGDLHWLSRGHIVSAGETLLADGNQAQVVRQKVGEGLLVVVSTDVPFYNRSVAQGDDGVMAFRILELTAPKGPIYFDEWINSAGAPKIVGLLLEPPFRNLTLQLLLVAVVFGWASSRHFGPLRSPRTAPRRSLREHAEALGNLHFKAGSARQAVHSYLEYFLQETGFRHHQRHAIALLAQRARLPTETVGSIMERAQQAAKNPRLQAVSAAQLVRGLAALKRKSQS